MELAERNHRAKRWATKAARINWNVLGTDLSSFDNEEIAFQALFLADLYASTHYNYTRPLCTTLQEALPKIVRRPDYKQLCKLFLEIWQEGMHGLEIYDAGHKELGLRIRKLRLVLRSLTLAVSLPRVPLRPFARRRLNLRCATTCSPGGRSELNPSRLQQRRHAPMVRNAYLEHSYCPVACARERGNGGGLS